MKLLRWLGQWFKKPKRQTRMVGRMRFRVRGPDGKVKREWWTVLNGDTTAGLNDMLSVYFDSGTQRTSWYMGLIAASPSPTLAGSDTMLSHGGWTESTAYSQSTRLVLNFGSASAGIITTTAVSFTMNAVLSIAGAFLVSESPKNGTGGILFATGLFESPQSLVASDNLDITIEKSLTAA